MKIRQVVAFDEARGIARVGDDRYPYGITWKIREDLRFFHDLTSRAHFGRRVLMGLGTFEAIGKPLDRDRGTFVLSKTMTERDGVTVVRDLSTFILQMQEADRDIWIGGGQELYAETIGITDELWATHVLGKHGCNRTHPGVPENFATAAATDNMQENGFTYHRNKYVPKQVVTAVDPTLQNELYA